MLPFEQCGEPFSFGDKGIFIAIACFSRQMLNKVYLKYTFYFAGDLM